MHRDLRGDIVRHCGLVNSSGPGSSTSVRRRWFTTACAVAGGCLSVQEVAIRVDPVVELETYPKAALKAYERLKKFSKWTTFTPEIKWMGSRRRITHRLQWQRRDTPIWVAPGAEINPALKTTVGVSTTLTKELSATLGLKQGNLAAKLNVQSTVLQQHEESYSVRMTNPFKDRQRAYLVWHVLHTIEIDKPQLDGRDVKVLELFTGRFPVDAWTNIARAQFVTDNNYSTTSWPHED